MDIGSWSVPAVRHGFRRPVCAGTRVVRWCHIVASLHSAACMSCRMPCLRILSGLLFLVCQYPCPMLPYSRGSHGHICLVIECCETGNCAPRSQAQCPGWTPLTGLACVCEIMENIGSFICFKVSESFCKKQAFYENLNDYPQSPQDGQSVGIRYPRAQ